MRDGAALQPEQKSPFSTRVTPHALQRQLAEQAGPVDATADDEDVRLAGRERGVERRSLGHGVRPAQLSTAIGQRLGITAQARSVRCASSGLDGGDDIGSEGAALPALAFSIACSGCVHRTGQR